ncbi:MAG: glycoside hydrolase family 95 protein, partial [Promethearchaeota archaeon]
MKKEKENGLNNNLKDLQNIHEIYKQLFESVPKISLDKPASKWDRAFPIGNGHLGAMIYGNVFEDVLQTNEDTLWSGFPRDQNNYDAIKHLEEVRELIFKGDYSAAKEIVEKKMLGKYMQAYMPFVNIHMRFLDSGGSPYGKKEKNLILKRVKKGWGNNNREDVEYIRELDLSRAVVSVKHRFLPVPPEDDIYIEREYFASHVDDAIFIKISLKGGSDKNKGSTSSKFNIELDLSSDLKITSKTLLFDNENRPYMVVRGQAPSYVDSYHRKIANSVRYDEADKSLRFEARLYVLSSSNKDLGKINEANKALSGSEGIIKILNTSEIILAFIGASNYGNKDPTEACDNIIRRIIKRFKENSFERIKEEHIVDYQNLFSKVELKFLPDENDAEQIIKQYSLERLSMDKRIYRLYNRRKRTLYFIRQILHLNRGGHLKKSISKAGLEFYNGSKDFDDLGLISTYFQFGRYLLISSSRKGSQPANLQGIWNDKINPPWASNYTININTEMNYWLADLTNLSECFEPLLKMVEELVDNGKKTAKIHYNCNGWCAHHNTTLWRQTHPVEGAALWAMWPFGGVWLCLNLWDHFLFNRDIELLRNRIYPLLKGSAEFLLDWLIKLP